MKKLFLIDGTALAYRSYFAMSKKPLINSKGENTSAIYGVANSLLKIISDEKPDYILVTFDSGKPTFRHQLYPEYKSTRAKMPDELICQLPLIKQLTEAMGLRTLEIEGVEADDAIGTVAKQASKKGIQTFIYSADKDFIQLMDERIELVSPSRGKIPEKRWNHRNISERYGVPPERFVDFLALLGDASDNIPGLPGVGKKTAASLMQKYENIEEIYKHLDQLPEKLQKKFIEGKDKLFLSRELIRIKTDIPAGVREIKELAPTEPDYDKLSALFKELEFSSLYDRFFAGRGKTKSCKVNIITADKFSNLKSALNKQKRIYFSVHGSSKKSIDANIAAISFLTSKGEADVVLFGENENLFSEEVPSDFFSQFKPIFENPEIKKVTHDSKYAIGVLKNYNVDLRGLEFDTLLASYLVEPDERKRTVKHLSLEYLGRKKINGELSESMADEADIIFELADVLKKRLEEKSLTSLISTLELPLSYVLADMERTGIRLDTDYLSHISSKIADIMDKMESEIYNLAGERFNINSPKQLQQILFVKLKLPVIKKTKTGFSTDSEVLEKLSPLHKLPRLIIEYRNLSKLKNTYVDALPPLVSERTGRLHTIYHQAVAATGRLSSADPNLQNIPTREDEFAIRKAFLPLEEGHLFLSADYSQIELRILAHLSGDKLLREAFEKGEDIHTRTASVILGKSPQDITSEDRRLAKTINFGIIYGMSPHGLAESLHISHSEAKELIDTYFSLHPGVKDFIEETKEGARKNGYVKTLMGRVRFVPAINSKNRIVREAAERVAVNTPVQGSAADMIKKAMIDIHRRITEERLGTRMLLQVHDELDFSVPEDELDYIRELVSDLMTQALPLSVPVKVDIGVGSNWFEAH